MRVRVVSLAVALLALAALAAGEGRAPASGAAPQPPRRWQRGPPRSDHRTPRHFVGPHVCRSRNSTHCCPGWTSRPNSLLCVVPVCRPDCGPGSCVAPNMCRCSDGVEAPNCGGGGGGYYPYPVRTRGGCPRICMNGGTCSNGTCSCAPGWSGEFCTEPICSEPCLHGGRCIAPDRCVCFQGFSGTRCEIDRRTGPCYTDHRGALCTNALEGVVCTKQMCCATVGIGWGHPCERCGELDCPVGHLRNLLTKECQDIDECAAVPGLCGGGTCVNSIGSFSCECPPGQRRHNVSNNCEDINECEDSDICPNGKCINTEGDYYCLCNPHFIPSPDKKYCIDSRISDCYTELTENGQCLQRLNKPLSNRDCCCGRNMGRAWGDFCAPCPPIGSTEWIHLCGGAIPPYWPKQGNNGDGNGYNNGTGNGKTHPDGRHTPPGPYMVKIDECTLRPGICGLGNCVDLEVGYHCDCWEGAQSTQPDGNPTCIDIDECALGWCEGGTCRNKDGGFHCDCPPGFDPVDDGRQCSDKDECSDTNGGMCSNGYCINSDGSFRCHCNPGYELTEAGHACQDVDECRANPRVCRRGRCWNTPGSYDCQCEPGFQSVAGYCADIDECAEKTLCQGGRCVNSEGSFQCVCEAGYRPTPDRGACADVDECAEQRVCRNGRCHNSPGSFRCECMPGFTLSSDGRTCNDEIQDLCYEHIEDGHCRGPGSVAVTRSQCCCGASKGQELAWGVSCKPCPKVNTTDFDILCPEGSGKDNTPSDINECTMIPGICAHGACENLEPGFRCICDLGYHSVADGICKDVDECDMHQSYCTGGQCRNTQGSFMCVCPSGTRYEPDDQLCRDIDECEGELPPVGYDYTDPRGDIPPLLFPELSNPCENGRCINTHGGYDCLCAIDYVLDASTKRCLDNRRGSCWLRIVDGKCEAAVGHLLLRQECCCSIGLAWGSPCDPCTPEDCPCPKGFAKFDGSSCRDVDECELDRELCAGGKCVNTDGSYRCECPHGLTLDSTGNLCVDTRLEYCYMEWSGGRCLQPLPTEVLRHTCCCSSIGKAWGDGRCEPCPKKGTEPYRNLCILESEQGPSVIGIRPPHVLPPGFTPSNWSDPSFPEIHPGQRPDGPPVVMKEVDVNECLAFPGLCNQGRCQNLPTGFTCDCFQGYGNDPLTHMCVDVNECQILDGVCGAGDCHNTEGGFRCHCHPGYRADEVGKVCLDIDECAETRGLCNGGRCVNTLGSFTCKCGAGMELAPDRLSCKDVDECSLTSGICSNGACENLMGTYQCVCDEGYGQSSIKSHCEDIDECTEDPTRCEHECINTPGSYHCECREGWKLRADQRSCRDVNECAGGARPCGGGECHNTLGSYTCTCGEGLLHAPDTSRPTCKDVDECSENPELCGAGECRNTIGSFVCRCPDGYSVKPEEGPACTDDDECALGTCDCHPAADCINLPGSFQCRCRDGWRGDGTECEDVDECLTNNGGCHPRATCRNTDGSFMCLCDTGYKGDGYSCVDIDECANDPTLCDNGHCINTAGGYECDCDVGFTRSDDSRSCLDLDECSTFDNVCVFGRCVNTYGMFKCICDKGYQPDNVDDLMPGFNCTDVDECQSPQSCQYGQCQNTPGSYVCRCPPNYELVSDGTACFDSRRSRCYSQVDLRSGIEHCSDSARLSDDGSAAACCCSVGTAWGDYCDLCPEPGSEEYQQLCPGGPGYQPILEPPSYVVTLADIDECAQHPALCEHGTCTNTFGSFMCTCGDGWRLSADEQRCEDIDECTEKERCHPGLCRNLPGSYVCLCPEGYVPMPNGKECVDVRQRQCYMDYDSETKKCTMPAGVPQTRYMCCCSLGRAWGAPCEKCPDKQSPDHVALCGKYPGQYIEPLSNKTKDIDECQLMPQLCKPGRCDDTSTGFQCACDNGYEHDNTSHLCRDIDECASGRASCRGLAQCVNSPGSYECRCPAGYARAPSFDECEDVDECADERVCEHGVCKNTIGTYRCECQPGYTLRDNVCRDVDECSRPRPLCRNGTCENLPGSYMCHCNEGFKQSATNDCIDINECREGGMVCRNGRCRNTVGSFRCDCAPGYTLTADGRNCRDVDECTEMPAPCGYDGAPSCTNTIGNYECACGVGWKLVGRQCVDRDECRELRDVCSGGECYNFNGGFRCECPTGWRFDEQATVCVDERRELCYDEWSGGHCHRARPVQVSHPACCCLEGAAWGRYCERCPSLGSPEFERICPAGMGRPNVNQDFNECVLRPDVCRGGRCINTDGSFRCECPEAYVRDDSGLACVDEDECATNPRVCGNGTCTNTEGGYECRCNKGFTQGLDQKKTCVDIDECAEGHASCMYRCHNTPGSYRCTCPRGYAISDDGVHCRDVDECATEANDCEHDCENTIGSFVCRCPEGYVRERDDCVDVDECEERPERCAPGVCLNTEGSFMCDCDQGYRPSDDGQACIDHRTGICYRSVVSGQCQPEPWSSNHNGGSTPTQVTKAQCCCTLGDAWGAECEECPPLGSPERMDLCSPHGSNGGGNGGGNGNGNGHGGGNGGGNNNGHGGGNGGGNNNGHGGGNGGGNNNGHGGGNNGHGGGNNGHRGGNNGHGGGNNGGDGGYGGNGGNGGHGGHGGNDGGYTDGYNDIDECAVMPDLCAPGRCLNTIGSFRCICGLGYRPSGDVCADIDECAARPPFCRHGCTNTRGSYECTCRDGYELDEDGAACRDVDECARASHTCQQTCTNSDGSYECSCQDGYEKRGDACIDVNECLEEGICPTPGKCVNLLGSYRCVCPRGFRLDATGTRCLDRDECEDGRCQAPCRNYAGGYRCECPSGTSRAASGGCVPQDACAAGPCGTAPCFALGASYRCGCPPGYGWDTLHAVCLQMGGGCAVANCLFGCTALGDSYECGCPAGYRLVGAGHCLTALDGALPPDDIGGAPVFPVRDQFRAHDSGDQIISTEGCFSCKVNGRRRRAPDEGLVFANGTVIRRHKKRSRRVRRWSREPEADLVVVSATPRQTWSRAPLLRLVPAEGDARAHYRIVYGNDEKEFALSKRDGAWALRLRRHVKARDSFLRQLEIEARVMPAPAPAARRRQRRARRHAFAEVPAPLRLYVWVRVAPPAPASAPVR